MFLKDSIRIKDGKEHHYWSLVENRRVDGGRKVVQRHVLYLGEINSSQRKSSVSAVPWGISVRKLPGSLEGMADTLRLN